MIMIQYSETGEWTSESGNTVNHYILYYGMLKGEPKDSGGEGWSFQKLLIMVVVNPMLN
jgi:hypothetical protein